MRTEGRRDGHVEANSRFSPFCKRAYNTVCVWLGEKITVLNVKQFTAPPPKKRGGYGTVINARLEDTSAIKFCFSHKTV